MPEHTFLGDMKMPERFLKKHILKKDREKILKVIESIELSCKDVKGKLNGGLGKTAQTNPDYIQYFFFDTNTDLNEFYKLITEEK